MKKIKVLFFIYQLGGGGAARTLLNIINHLDRSKFIPILVTLNFNGTYEQELKPDVKFIKLHTNRLRKSLIPLAKVMKQERPDIVFSTHFPDVNVIAVLARILSFTGAKSVIREADNLGGNLLANLKLLCFGVIYKLAHQIISLSQGVKENLVKRYKVNGEDIKVIYNPVDLRNINEKIEDGQIELQYQKLFETDEKIIVTAGRLVKQKDHQTLLHAFTKVKQNIPSRLIILGEGPLKDDLMQLAVDLGIQNSVHFIGFQSNPYIYFKHADLFVLSSIHEGFSHVLVEALATGTPVVSTNCSSGPAEVLHKGEYGYLCEVGNADDMAEKMLKVLTLNKDKLAEMIEKGTARAKHFEAKRIVQQYEDMFLDTLQNK